jgi:hypothetical protein
MLFKNELPSKKKLSQQDDSKEIKKIKIGFMLLVPHGTIVACWYINVN